MSINFKLFHQFLFNTYFTSVVQQPYGYNVTRQLQEPKDLIKEIKECQKINKITIRHMLYGGWIGCDKKNENPAFLSQSPCL
jgi:hypothetical protein